MGRPNAAWALTREERIRRRPEFLRIQRRGVRTPGRYMTLIGLPNAHALSRLGIVAPRRLGKAVRRNYAKRQVREFFRHNKPAAELDLVVLPRREFLDAPFAVLLDDIAARFAARSERTARREAGASERRAPTDCNFQHGLLIPVWVLFLRGYRVVISPLFAGSCRFEPSCSHYAEEAVRRHGSLRGFWLTVRRIGRCQPFHAGGYDPVPPRADHPGRRDA